MDEAWGGEDSCGDAPSIARMREYAAAWSRSAEAGVELLVRSGLAADKAVLAAWGEPGGVSPDVLAEALRGPEVPASQRPANDVALTLLAGDLYPLDLTEGLPGVDQARCSSSPTPSLTWQAPTQRRSRGPWLVRVGASLRDRPGIRVGRPRAGGGDLLERAQLHRQAVGYGDGLSAIGLGVTRSDSRLLPSAG